MSREHALVIGGGIAGLLAAHVASEHFERVTILDRDRFPAEPGPRDCVPQGRHLHLLMARGLRAFEELLPGFSRRLASAGAGLFDFAADTALDFPSGWMPRFRSEIEVHACTRDLLEWTLRRRVMESERIRASTGRQVLGLIGDSARITGVRLADGTVEADLVIETCGRASRAPEWLRALGCPRVDETVVEAPIDYASRWYEIPEGFTADWKLLAVSPRYPEIRRSGTICRVEGGRWNVLLLGLDGEEVPADEAGFLDFARRLAVPELYDAVRQARPVSPIHRYRNNRNRIRHYERLAEWPRRFVVLGDAVCALNPYAGLGMTSSALAVLALREHLDRPESSDGDDLARGLQRRFAEVHRPAWRIATNQHLRWPDEPDGDPSPRPPLADYLERLMVAAVRDTEVGRALLAVMHMLEPSDVLFAPDIRNRVMAVRPPSRGGENGV